MHIKRLPPGQRPSDEGWDYIEVTEDGGSFRVRVSLQFDPTDSFGTQAFGTREEAEAAGIEWAAKHEAVIVYMVTIKPVGLSARHP